MSLSSKSVRAAAVSAGLAFSCVLLGTVKFLAHFLTGGRPAVRYGYSCSSDTSR